MATAPENDIWEAEEVMTLLTLLPGLEVLQTRHTPGIMVVYAHHRCRLLANGKYRSCIPKSVHVQDIRLKVVDDLPDALQRQWRDPQGADRLHLNGWRGDLAPDLVGQRDYLVSGRREYSG